MQLLELTLDSPAANLALDEALLLSLETSEGHDFSSVLRLWESTEPIVVLGRGSRIAEEVHVDVCRQLDVPILRRCSGGATVVAGPGCLMYSLVCRFEARQELPAVDQVHNRLLGQIAAAMSTDERPVVRSGTSDLAIETRDGLRKFSGNSLRIRRHLVLYHGTCLYDFPLAKIEQYLKMPPRMPTYRQARSHGSFVCNLSMSRVEIQRRLIRVFAAAQPCSSWPRELTQQLVEQRYSQDEWNLRV